MNRPQSVREGQTKVSRVKCIFMSSLPALLYCIRFRRPPNIKLKLSKLYLYGSAFRAKDKKGKWKNSKCGLPLLSNLAISLRSNGSFQRSSLTHGIKTIDFIVLYLPGQLTAHNTRKLDSGLNLSLTMLRAVVNLP